MQIIPFPAHYQSVYTNFDIFSFSLINCFAKCMKKLSYFIQKAMLDAAFCWITNAKRVIDTLLRLRISDKFEVEVDGNAR